ncbi:hypothetical protein SAMN06265222_106138 [Neorhodopirellula lusitana]|uniref:Protein kinase domain-containing protein n=1 Tax=Neorhodopirellula lusitana TaxID=445327 RepID=A0ABY1Q6M2_9BACT|nr:serine/threonine-protein kinase [Neorhodopirellula lusitana]SMP58864.1 hypothetical protein SAMN06265222_106138 [Neorhodopirellula lusitana]
MNLSDLPARELARLDAVCMEYETRLRESRRSGPTKLVSTQTAEDIEIEPLIQRFGGEYADLLRDELEAIRVEVESETKTGQTPTPGTAQANSTGATRPEAFAGGHNKTAANKVAANTPATGTVAGSERHEYPTQILTPPGSPNTPANQVEGIDNAALIADGLPPLGTEIGPYLLTSVLGRGGMGIVYRATDSRLDRSVAIKMLSVRGKQSDSLIERFQREAKAVAGLTNPHIVELFDVGVFEGLPYAVMEHLRGQTLMQVLRATRGKQIPVLQIRRWGLQLAEALSVAHQNGVIHRDLKPENVMVVSHTSVAQQAAKEHTSLKLFDFGLSRISASIWAEQESAIQTPAPQTSFSSMSEMIAAESKHDSSRPEFDSATRAGMILGTPGYMAPEQARGDVITPATDVFALGCVLFETMFDRPAFEGETATKRFTAVLEKQALPDPMRRRDDVGLTDLILAMLAKDPAKRPTAAQVVQSLRPNNQHADGKSQSPNVTRAIVPPNVPHEVVISRRRLVELSIGATVGGILGAAFLPGASAGRLTDIKSIGVLTFQKAGTTPIIEGEDAVPRPAGEKTFDTGELLSGLLVNELSRISDFMVPKFVPMTASQPADFREAARLLEVDAIVTGTYTEAQPGQQIMTVNLEIISGRTGKLIEAMNVPTSAGGNLIEQSALAHRLAERIGRELTAGKEAEVDHPEAFTCLIKGRVRSDPDSTAGLRMALKCFEHAVSVDFNYAQAHAGLGLTAITLAGRESAPRVGELIVLSQESTARALLLDPTSPDAMLADAMLDYQVLNDFDSATAKLTFLTKQHPHHWQVQHQAGWLEMIRFNEASGLQYLRRATGLHPASYFLKTDLARADWFRGYPSRAISANLAMLRDGKDEVALSFVRGLLIDLYEQSEDYAAAANTDPELEWSPSDGDTKYFIAREERLQALPYGPFGETLNKAILQIRRKDTSNREPADHMLARLISAQLPMLPLVLCKHPAFASMTLLEQAVETFPVLKIG